ncbi:cilia- and flagella-associated protein 184 isoform 2-T2 [Discoglossus pictus]
MEEAPGNIPTPGEEKETMEPGPAEQTKQHDEKERNEDSEIIQQEDKQPETEEQGNKEPETEEQGDKEPETIEQVKHSEAGKEGNMELEIEEEAISQEQGEEVQSTVEPDLSAGGGKTENVGVEKVVSEEEPDEVGEHKARPESSKSVHKEDAVEPQKEEDTELQELKDEKSVPEVEEQGDKDMGLQEEEKVDDEQAREALIQKYQALASERDKMKQQNYQLQNKLYEYFRRKKSDDTRPENEKHTAELEQRYQKYMSTLVELRKQHTIVTTWRQQQAEELKARCQEMVNRVDQEWKAFQDYKRKLTLFGVGYKGKGKPHALPSAVHAVEQLQAREERKEKDVILVRLENIKLKNQIHHIESIVRAKEELAEGLHLIDFEQLKIENQTYNEKIEERNEELLKLRKKITNTVEVLTHFKEKLDFVQEENEEQRERLREVEAHVGHKRDILTKTKQARDNLRMDNLRLKQQCGLLGSKVLLRDYEDKVDITEEMSQKLEGLKRHHAELTLSTKGIIKKIDEATFVMQK